MVGTPGPQMRFTPQEDHDILRLRAQGYSWRLIAADVGRRRIGAIQQRHKRLTDGPLSYSASNDALPLNDGVDREVAKRSCDALLRRQLATGQFSGAARAAWLDRHGDA